MSRGIWTADRQPSGSWRSSRWQQCGPLGRRPHPQAAARAGPGVRRALGVATYDLAVRERRDPHRALPDGARAGRRRQPHARRPPLDHGQHGGARQRPTAQPVGPVNALKQRCLRILNAAGGDIRLESFLGPVVGRHVVALAALLVESGRRWPASPFAFESARMVPSTTLLLVAGGRERNYG